MTSERMKNIPTDVKTKTGACRRALEKFVFEKKHMFDLFSAGREIIDSICAYVFAAAM